MNKFFLFAFFFAVIFESTFFPFPLTFLCLLGFYPFLGEKAEIWAFFWGLILDIFLPRTFGLDSLIFLLAVFILRRYQRKIRHEQIIFQVVFMIFTLSFYTFVFYRNLTKEILAIILICSLVFSYALRKFLKEGIKEKKLAL